MNPFRLILLASSMLALTGCNATVQQWIDPDHTFATMPQPAVKGVNDTQEDMAKEAVANGDYARAADFYQQLTASQKGTAEQQLRYKMGLADSVRRLGRAENALHLYDELYEQNPGNLDIAEGRALSLMASGKTADAGRAFGEIMEKDPKRWRTLNAIGILFVTKNMIPEALQYYDEALNQSPDNAAVLNNVGLSQAIDHNYDRALKALDQASRVAKTGAQRKQVEMNEAMVVGISGDLDRARELASKYYEGPALDNNLGLYAHLAKDDNLARSYLNMALTQSPIYYERAWENLDVVNDAGRSDSTEPKPAPEPKPSASAKLPSMDAVKAPVQAPVTRSVKGGKKKSGKKAEAPTLPEIKAAADPEAKLTPPAPLKEEPKPGITTDEKPAGLIVNPGE